MDILEFRKHGNKALIVSFGGHFEDRRQGGFVFVNFLQQRLGHVDQLFLMDTHCSCYHKGVGGVSTNIDETAAFLRDKIRGYGHVVFLGNSGGGYAALLFGALLGVPRVVAFVPPTLLLRSDRDEKYSDVLPFVQAAMRTTFEVYGDCSVTDEAHSHHISQCDRLAHLSHVSLHRLPHLDLRELRDSGELLRILNKSLCNKT